MRVRREHTCGFGSRAKGQHSVAQCDAHLEEAATQGEDVDPLVIRLAEDHLRRHVQEGARLTCEQAKTLSEAGAPCAFWTVSNVQERRIGLRADLSADHLLLVSQPCETGAFVD